jgi:MFS transporter, DHA2 family, multidrug resistance protein
LSVQGHRTNYRFARRSNYLTTRDAGRAALDEITRQALIKAYIDDFKLLMIATLSVIPLLIVFKQASDAGGPDHTLAVE